MSEPTTTEPVENPTWGIFWWNLLTAKSAILAGAVVGWMIATSGDFLALIDVDSSSRWAVRVSIILGIAIGEAVSELLMRAPTWARFLFWGAFGVAVIPLILYWSRPPIEGTWRPIAPEAAVTANTRLVFRAGEFQQLITVAGEDVVERAGTYELNTRRVPAEIDLTITRADKNETVLGIFKIDRDKMLIVWGRINEARRPDSFDTPPEGGSVQSVQRDDR